MKTLGEVAAWLGGTVQGDLNLPIRGLAGLKEAESGDLSFLAHVRHSAQMATTRASAVLVAEDWQGTSGCALVRVKDPDQAFIRVALWLTPPVEAQAPGVHPTVILGSDVTLGAGVSIGPYTVIASRVSIGAGTVIGPNCFIGNDSRIGANGLLYASVCIRERVQIGERVILHHGVVIGSDGFGYSPQNGRWIKIPQTGTVEIGDDVELGANTTVDRARFGKTILGNGVKLDNLCQIGHNARIGDHTAMAAHAAVAGSTIVGKGVQLGGQVGLAGHLEVGDGAVVAGQSGVTKDVPPGAMMFGSPAMTLDRFRRVHMHMLRLPELKAEVVALEARLAKLEAAGGGSEERIS